MGQIRFAVTLALIRRERVEAFELISKINAEIGSVNPSQLDDGILHRVPVERAIRGNDSSVAQSHMHFRKR